jgi:hypothetical protein
MLTATGKVYEEKVDNNRERYMKIRLTATGEVYEEKVDSIRDGIRIKG